MDLKLKDKVIFIAGASRGIGLGIAEACLAEGAKLFLTARGAAALEESIARLTATYGEGRVAGGAGDMRDAATIDAMLDQAEAELGPIWGAVANVGIHPCPRGFEVGDEDWDAGINQNLGSAYKLARGALRLMVPRGAGSLVLISSLAGVNSVAAPLTYSVSKAAVNHLTKDLSRFVGTGIRVNAIAPGYITFPGSEWEERMKGPMAAHWQGMIDRDVPLQRFGTPEEIGSVAAFLLSPVTSYMTGAIVPVDGGQAR